MDISDATGGTAFRQFRSISNEAICSLPFLFTELKIRQGGFKLKMELASSTPVVVSVTIWIKTLALIFALSQSPDTAQEALDMALAVSKNSRSVLDELGGARLAVETIMGIVAQVSEVNSMAVGF